MISISISIQLAIVLDIHHAIVTIVTIPKFFTTVTARLFVTNSPQVPSRATRGDGDCRQRTLLSTFVLNGEGFSDPVDGFYCRIPSGNPPRTGD